MSSPEETGLSYGWKGMRLFGTFAHTPVRPRALALVLHGWTGSRMSSARSTSLALADVGVTCLAPDLPGHGDSQGEMLQLTRAQFVDAALRSYDAMLSAAADDGYSGLPIIVVGTSFGGYLAAHVAAARPARALALRVPANYPDDGYDDLRLGEVMRPEDAPARWNWLGEPRAPGDTAALRAVRDFPGPVLVQEAGADTVIHPQTLRNYEAAARAGADPARLTTDLIDGAPHGLSTSPSHLAAANAALATWIERVLAGRATR